MPKGLPGPSRGLVRRFDQQVLRFLDTMVNNRQDAEDLAQDTFVKAYKNIHRFNPEYKFATWLFYHCQTHGNELLLRFPSDTCQRP